MATTKRASAEPAAATKRAVRKRPESTLLAQVRLAVGARPDFLVTRINTGVFEVATPTGRNARVRSAPDGFPDLIGTQLRRIQARKTVEGGFMRHDKDYWQYYGQAIAIETKAPKGTLSEAQENWRAAFERVGGVYIVARSVDDVLHELGYDVPEWCK